MSESTLTYGLNSGGFVRMRLPEIRRLILSELKIRTGYDFDDSPDSFTGQLISIFAERLAAVWELAEQAYLSAYPVSAQGLSLDLAVSYAGVRRLQPIRSRAAMYVFGAPGAVAPAGMVIQALVASDSADVPPRFTLDYAVTCTKAKAIGAQITVPYTFSTGSVFWVEIAGVRYSHISLSGQIDSQVATALRNLIGNDAIVSNATITIYRPAEFVIDWSNNFTVNYVASLGSAVAEQFGPIPAAERVIRKVINPPADIIDVYNPFAAVVGQILETDDKVRVRYQEGVYRLGAGTQPSIIANIKQNITGITSAKLLVNDKDVQDGNGLPPHSIELIVEGGVNQDIFNEIYRVKGAGITSFGNLSGTVKGEDGYLNPISFSRPEMMWIWIRVSYSVNVEENTPNDLSGQIIKAILSEGATIIPGQDVILQRLSSAPFRVTNALNRVTLTAAVTLPNAVAPTTYSLNDIVINPRQKAAFDPSRIFIV